jgi:tricarballylate dehydrogenase
VVEPDVIGSLAENAGPTIAWLKQFGIRFDFLPTQFLTKSQPRLLPVGGGLALVEGLAARAEQFGVSFFYETSATALDMDQNGRVAGLFARTRGVGPVRFAGQVVLACGGFEGNAEMLARYIGPRAVFLRPICKGANFNRGEGIQMALDVGAATSGDFSSFHAEPIDPRSGVSEPSVFVFPYGILVNKDGVRFVDEAPGTVDAHYEPITRRIFEQRDGLAYVVLDAKHTRVPNYRLSIRTNKAPIAADSIGELATAIGIPAAALESTVAQYNAACVPGEYRPLELDHLATSGLQPPKSNWALPIDEAPFHAYPIISANVFTFGGLKIDAEARVLNGDGEVIVGLYAAGEIIGTFYRHYPGATSVMKGLVFGRLAGVDAARRRNQA